MDECNLTPNRVLNTNQQKSGSNSGKIDNNDGKCPSTVSSYVGGFLQNIEKSDSAKGIR